MSVKNINPVNLPNVTFQSNPIKEEKELDLPKNEETIEKKKVAGYVLATALSAAVLGGAIVHGKTKGLRTRLSNALNNNNILQGENSILRNEKELLGGEKLRLEELNRTLQEALDKTKNKFNEIFEGEIAPKDVKEQVVARLREIIGNKKLSYDITEQPIIKKEPILIGEENVLDLPTSVYTTNRAAMQNIEIPKIEPDGRFKIDLPQSEEMRISTPESIDFKPVHKQATTISENYADSVVWDNDKIARDIMQNFYDGHGQTLDGVMMKFEPLPNGKYKVRIEGKSTYTADKAIYLGESTKRNDPKAAGNYGEGLKMATLKLLKDGGASEVKIASDNWKLTYEIAEGNISDKQVLTYSLDKVDKISGNYLEFETNDKSLLESLRNSINRFYHSSNPDFKCPDFENNFIGIKRIGPNEKGGFYIAGQKFEVDGSFEGLKNYVIFLKEKPPVDVLDPSRDRISLNGSNLRDIGRWVARSKLKVKDEEFVQILKSLEKVWDFNTGYKVNSEEFLEGLISSGRFCRPKIKFPSNYVAYSNASPDIVMDLRMKGYKVCKEDFADFGMPTIHDVVTNGRAHDIVVPNELEKRKILILKEAIEKLKPSLEKENFTADEIDTHIYMFDRTTPKEKELYADCNAEAIIDFGVSKGFWIDKGYLNKTSFFDALETALHELCHKAGGDESANFSYKLTNLNSNVLDQLGTDSKTNIELKALKELWDESTFFAG